MKSLFYLTFMATFGVYGLGLVGVLDHPTASAQTHTQQTQAEPQSHYTLKAMR